MTRKLAGWLWVLPALAFYGTFVLFPVAQTVQYSFYDWDGIGVATWAGLDNYARVFGNSELYGSIVNAFILILFFAIIPIVIGLMAAAVLREVRGRFGNAVARTVLFLPQIIPLAGAAIAWSWMYSTDGVVNQLLRAVGLGGIARAWLGDFSTALPAIGLIGTWVSFGLCTVLFSAGIGKIDPSLYEAARLDGAGRVREFLAITVPGLRQEIVVALTVLVIAALASFDIIYVATLGGPGYSTMVPGLMIYRLTFTAQQVGVASALAVVLVVLVVAIVVPLQRLRREA
ncbi:MAG: sugar ABC transporter permease [Tessaracoccus sp.]|uniref:carbohydrate ABC transporter permease n=1 Tax=Tessaracoccus sp. TaxID=1971211 RepID=UPI001EC6779D|nr:sugar ABC transporter permease [Tessaracoccus sp.]MBK7822428.1 sugar ABC transporter permease [Tessaracoccus sp.]